MNDTGQDPCKKLNIAFVSREFPPSRRQGGIATYLQETATCLAAMGHTVHVVAASDDFRSKAEYIERGIHVIRLPGGDFFLGEKPTWNNKLLSHWRSVFHHRRYRTRIADCLSHLVNEHGVELIEFAEYGNEFLVWAEKERPLPWIVRLHGSVLLNRESGRSHTIFRSPFRWWFGRHEMLGTKKANAISSCGKHLADLEACFIGMDPKEIQVIPNAIRFETMQAPKDALRVLQEDRAILFGVQAEYYVFSAGSVTEGKGYGELVEAVRLLRHKGINIALTIAGKWGSLGLDLANKSRNNSEYISWLHLLGAMPRKELPTLYASADLVVFPSWWEPLGLVLLEAMAAGGLVIGSTEGGMSEVIDEGETGFLVAPKDIVQLAEKIKNVLNIPRHQSDQIRSAAIAAIKSRYDIDEIIEEQILFYLSVINKFHQMAVPYSP